MNKLPPPPFRSLISTFCFLLFSFSLTASPLRPPAVPLVTHTPYFSIWSPADRLTDKPTIHWTGRNHPLTGLIRIDGETFRILGDTPASLPALPQASLSVQPTRSLYRFTNAHLDVALTFTSPHLPDDLDVLARPVSYITWQVTSRDGKPHDVSLFLAAHGDLGVETPHERVVATRESLPGLAAARLGHAEQYVLGSSGDDHRANWGWVWLASAAPRATVATDAVPDLTRAFTTSGTLPATTNLPPTVVATGLPALAVVIPLGSITNATATHLLGHDEVLSMQYFSRKLKPYWKRNGATLPDALAAAHRDQDSILARCAAFDAELIADAERLGGSAYAALCSLAHRQAIAACSLAADDNGAPLLFPKENHSNGCTATVDVLYPQIPHLLLLSPTLAKAIVVPPADYGASPAWPYPEYAPHDLGQHPFATGQVYGMGNATNHAVRMPVEECGNMILALAAIVHLDQDIQFANRWWPQLTAWAAYLEKQGFDPENQLCTDDFAGHLAHNANLSVKSILALAAYGKLAGLRGDTATATRYETLARDFAQKWIQAADDGDKFRLAFDQPGSWSQKYNLVWNRILGLNIFPPDVARKEIAWYRRSLNTYGLPLDSRKGYTKSDWTLWSATLGDGRPDIEAFSQRLVAAYSEMDNRQPMTDWLETQSAKKVGFTARSVVGGYFMPFLADPVLWKKYAARDRNNPRTHIWAPLPPPYRENNVIRFGAEWRYTTNAPAAAWTQSGFDDATWTTGRGHFGRNPGKRGVNTEWTSPGIWLRRQITLPATVTHRLLPVIRHDDDVEVFLNGVPLVTRSGINTGHPAALSPTSLNPEAAALLKPGATLTLAVHCRQHGADQVIDIAFVDSNRD